MDLGKCLMARKPFQVISAFTQFLVLKYPSIITIILRLSVSLTSNFFFLNKIRVIFIAFNFFNNTRFQHNF